MSLRLALLLALALMACEKAAPPQSVSPTFCCYGLFRFVCEQAKEDGGCQFIRIEFIDTTTTTVPSANPSGHYCEDVSTHIIKKCGLESERMIHDATDEVRHCQAKLSAVADAAADYIESTYLMSPDGITSKEYQNKKLDKLRKSVEALKEQK